MKTGQWIGVNNMSTVDALVEVLRAVDPLGYVSQLDFINELQKSGLVRRGEYYVPEMDELYRARRLAIYRQGSVTGLRWVMCRETRDALLWRYAETLVPVQQPVAWASALEVEETDSHLTFRSVRVIESNRHWGDNGDRLFGIPIRLDPAARSPMFEIYEEDE